MFINSEPPAFRKARALAIQVSSFEATFLQHMSYIDTTKLMVLDEGVISAALADPDRSAGRLMTAVRDRIVGMVGSHQVMPEEERLAVMSDYPPQG
jgi:hypothetical protein